MQRANLSSIQSSLVATASLVSTVPIATSLNASLTFWTLSRQRRMNDTVMWRLHKNRTWSCCIRRGSIATRQRWGSLLPMLRLGSPYTLESAVSCRRSSLGCKIKDTIDKRCNRHDHNRNASPIVEDQRLCIQLSPSSNSAGSGLSALVLRLWGCWSQW